MRPRILISGSKEGWEPYIEAVAAAGGEPCPFYLPPADGGYDGLLLCGGGDVHPRRYGQENTGSTDIDEARDGAEFALAGLYIAMKKPILGVCRGLQLLNIALGGDLIQDIGDHLHLFHTKGDLPDDRVHPVRADREGFLFPMLGETFAVNSAHHQAVGRLGAGLRAAAWSEGGLVEAIEHDPLPIRGVQWHPERMSFARERSDAPSCAAIFHWFIGAAGGEGADAPL